MHLDFCLASEAEDVNFRVYSWEKMEYSQKWHMLFIYYLFVYSGLDDSDLKLFLHYIAICLFLRILWETSMLLSCNAKETNRCWDKRPSHSDVATCTEYIRWNGVASSLDRRSLSANICPHRIFFLVCAIVENDYGEIWSTTLRIGVSSTPAEKGWIDTSAAVKKFATSQP